MKKVIILLVLFFNSSILLATSLKQNQDFKIEKLTRRIINKRDMNNTDRQILYLAEKTALDCIKVLEDAINKDMKTEEEIFSTLYFPEPNIETAPTYKTFYDDYTDKYITPIEDKLLDKNKNIVFVVLVDKNGYLPSHNTKYSQSRTGDLEKDLKTNRTKRIFNDITGFLAARNLDDFLLQSYYRDTGEVMADLSVPIFVKGKHWGALRIGYIRSN